jgi:hypothetical protein
LIWRSKPATFSKLALNVETTQTDLRDRATATDAAFTEEMGAEIGPTMDPSAHWDQVLLIVHLGGTSPQ